MPDEEKLIELNDLEDKALFRLELEVAGRVLNGLLELQLALPRHVQRWEQVGDETKEDWNRKKLS